MNLENAIQGFANIAKTVLETETKAPVLTYHSPEEYHKKLDLRLTEQGCTEASFFQLLEQIALLTPRTNSSAFFNQLFAGRTAPSLSAELLTSVLNTTMHTYKVAGVQVLIEKVIVQAFLEAVGYENGEGIMNPGGSMSNMVSMLIARNEKDAAVLKEGLGRQKMIVYTSVESHYSIRKNAGILGIGKDNVRKIESNHIGAMDVAKLEAAIQADLAAGDQPFYINATAGTTVLGAFDPFEDIATIAKKYQLWFHIDGALGGSALLSKQHQHLLQGSPLSDSFTWNAHKMMNLPVSASFLLLKQKGLLQKHLSEKADYLFQEEEEQLDLGNMSIQCGRRVDALKVWAAWKYYGKTGLEQRIDHLFDLAQYAAARIERAPLLALFRQPESVNVCFTVAGVAPEELCAYLHQEGMAMVGYSKAKGTTFVRMACLNTDLSFGDVDGFFDRVLEAGLELKGD